MILKNNTLFKNCMILLVVIILIVIIIYCFTNFNENFNNGSGYGLNNKLGKTNTLIPLNLINKSTDFNLFSLNSQLKFSFLKPASEYINTNTNDGIISKLKKAKKIILFPGLTDVILKQNNNEVWPSNFNKIDNNKTVTLFDNNNGHFNTITTIIENAKYQKGVNYNTIIYDFRNLQNNLDNIIKTFISYLGESTVIIAYDFGCVLANIIINILYKSGDTENLSKIEKYLMIAPTIGGVPMTLRDYISGNGIINTKLIENYESIILSLPCPHVYKEPIAIYNNISYTAKNMENLLNIAGKPSKLYKELHPLQEISLILPEFINCIIVTSKQFNTPFSYDFSNDFNINPQRYRPKNNNQLPNDDIHYSGTFEGSQTVGDGVVPFFAIEHFIKNNNNCNLELIKDKNHFTILKSYELALIILSNI